MGGGLPAVLNKVYVLLCSAVYFFDLSVCQYTGFVVKASVFSVNVFNTVCFYCATAGITQPILPDFFFVSLRER